MMIFRRNRQCDDQNKGMMMVVDDGLSVDPPPFSVIELDGEAKLS